MSDVIIVTGPPGAGKTTVARQLAHRFERAVHLHTDDFWHAIVSGAIPPYLPESDSQNQTVVSVTASAAFGYAAGGYVTIVDGIVGPWMLHHYLRASRENPDTAVHYVILRPDRRTALRRALGRTEPDALTDEHAVLTMWDQFAELGSRDRHVLDTTGLSVADTVDTVRGAVQAGLHRI